MSLPGTVRVPAEGPHYNVGQGRRFGETVILRNRLSAAEIAPAADLDADLSVISIGFIIDGAIELADSRARLVLGGAMAHLGLYPRFRAIGAIDTIVVRMPVAALERIGVSITPRSMHRPLHSRLVNATRAYLMALLNEHGADDPGSPVETTTLHLIAALLLEDDRTITATRAARATLVERANEIIRAEASHPTTTPVYIARRLQVSPRSLQRAFRDIGTSPATELVRRRVEIAEETLRGAGRGGATVTEVAESAGFSSARQLREAMKTHLGLTPRAVRG